MDENVSTSICNSESRFEFLEERTGALDLHYAYQLLSTSLDTLDLKAESIIETSFMQFSCRRFPIRKVTNIFSRMCMTLQWNKLTFSKKKYDVHVELERKYFRKVKRNKKIYSTI